MQHLDQQFRSFHADLQQRVGLSVSESQKVATLVASEIRFLPKQVKAEIAAASPVPLQARRDELIAFQAWNDIVHTVHPSPPVTRAQVIVQNYICFSYLKDACFEVIAHKASADSVAARCARYLTKGAVRDFRNAFAHANWCYKPDFSGLRCWVREDARRPESALREFEVTQSELDFWQTLSRAVAYSTYIQLLD